MLIDNTFPFKFFRYKDQFKMRFRSFGDIMFMGFIHDLICSKRIYSKLNKEKKEKEKRGEMK